MSKCGFRGTVQVPSAVQLYRLHAKGRKYLEMSLTWSNNVTKIVHGLNYSLRDGEGVTHFLQTCRQSSDPQRV